MGAIVAFVVWIVAMALIYALVQSQAQKGAYTGVVRVAGLRTILFAGQSALTEAAYIMRNPPPSGTNILDSLEGGATTGTVHEPEATRAKYKELLDRQMLTIGAVTYDVVSKPATRPSTEPWLVDLAVRVSYAAGGTKFTRQIRRRCIGQGHVVREIMGPKKGQVVLTGLSMYGEPLVEVMDR